MPVEDKSPRTKSDIMDTWINISKEYVVCLLMSLCTPGLNMFGNALLQPSNLMIKLSFDKTELETL